MSCAHCSGLKMTITEFKTQFKPGDFIQGWSTGKIVQITAIGEQRFLYRDVGSSHRNGEYVRAITAPWLWRKVERK